jgi:hypothetical protein
MSSKRAGVMVGIGLAVLASWLVVPALARLHARAVGEGAKERIGKLALALHACQNAHRSLPPAFDAFAGIDYPASLHVHLLPFLQQEELYQRYLLQGAGAADASLVFFHAPEDGTLASGAGVQNFAANLRIFADVAHQHHNYDNKALPLATIMPGHAKIPGSFVCGTSNTFVFATKFAACTQNSGEIPMEGGSRYDANPTSPYAAFFGENAATKPAHATDAEATFQLAPRPGQSRVWPLMAQSFSSRGILVAMADGSARVIGSDMSSDSWNYALQAYSGNIGGDW